MNRKVLIGFVVLLWIGLAGLIYFLWTNIKPAYKGTLLDQPSPVADFILQSDQGDINLSQFRGKVVLLFFGYTFCPDVCPTSLAKISRAFQLLGEDSSKIQTIFISVDPERDTPGKLGQYARAFNPAFIGATSTPENIAIISKQFGVFYEKHDVNSAADYLVSHTSVVLVIDQNGNLRLVWPYEFEIQSMVSDLKLLIAEN